MTVDGDWVPAGDLDAGDRLVDAAGNPVTIEAVSHRGAVATVHNLTVDTDHTYTVATGDGTDVVTHNDGSEDALRHAAGKACPLPGAANTAGRGADNVMDGVRLRARLAGEEISGGHSYTKHVVEQGEYPHIRTRGQFAELIEDVVMNGEMRTLNGGRSAYWRDGTVVIRNPKAGDGGTAFRPTDGYDYFLNLH